MHTHNRSRGSMGSSWRENFLLSPPRKVIAVTSTDPITSHSSLQPIVLSFFALALAHTQAHTQAHTFTYTEGAIAAMALMAASVEKASIGRRSGLVCLCLGIGLAHSAAKPKASEVC